MKMKEIELRGGRASLAPLGSATGYYMMLLSLLSLSQHALANPRGGGHQGRPFSCCFWSKNLQNNRLAHPPQKFALLLRNPGSATDMIAMIMMLVIKNLTSLYDSQRSFKLLTQSVRIPLNCRKKCKSAHDLAIYIPGIFVFGSAVLFSVLDPSSW